MGTSIIPKKLDDWNIDVLNELIKLRDIESETFDFKGTEIKDLSRHICAMANTKGGFLVLGIDEDKHNPNSLLGFKKIGFDIGRENQINVDIRNQIIQIEPTPEVNTKPLYEDEKFYVVMNVENNVLKKPFCIKNQGQFYVRVRDSSTPASRSVVLELFTNLNQKLQDIASLRSAALLLKKELISTLNRFRSLAPNKSSKVPPIDLSHIRNATLSCEAFLSENDLLGHTTENSLHKGIVTVLHTLETLNVYINGFNIADEVKTRQILQENACNFGFALHNDLEEVPRVLDLIIQASDNFLAKYKEAE